MTAHGISHPRKRAFLAAYRQSGNIRASTEAAGVERRTYYDWTENDLVFAAAAQQAKEEFGDLLEAKLSQLAMKADNVTALIVALKMAGRFVEKTRSELSGPGGAPIQHEDVSDTRERLAGSISQLAARRGTIGLAQEPL